MKFEINTTLKGIKDEPLQITVKDVIIQSLLSPAGRTMVCNRIIK